MLLCVLGPGNKKVSVSLGPIIKSTPGSQPSPDLQHPATSKQQNGKAGGVWMPSPPRENSPPHLNCLTWEGTKARHSPDLRVCFPSPINSEAIKFQLPAVWLQFPRTTFSAESVLFVCFCLYHQLNFSSIFPPEGSSNNFHSKHFIKRLALKISSDRRSRR